MALNAVFPGGLGMVLIGPTDSSLPLSDSGFLVQSARHKQSALSAITADVEAFKNGIQLTRRTATIPADLLLHLCETVPGFSKETPAHQHALAKMAWAGMTKANRHSRHPDAMSFSKQYLDEQFGFNKFPEINRRLNFFTRSAGWSRAEKETRAYWYTSELREAINSYLAGHAKSKSVELVMADGKKLKTVPPAVESKDKSGVTTTA